LNSSSCSAYGSALEDWVDEETTPRPVTPYAESKIRAEVQLEALADAQFCVVSYRNATAFGYTRNFRSDLVVNDLTAGALLRGLLKLNSDGMAWRPIVHADDIAQAFALGLEADSSTVNGEIINIGDERQNYRVLEIAEAVANQLPDATLEFAEGASPDRRSYRVRFEKVQRMLPAFSCKHDLESGIADMVANLRRIGLTDPRHGVRLARLELLRAAGALDDSLRLEQPGAATTRAAAH
jgi:nucleoside-diphosphate-sugar epimerase